MLHKWTPREKYVKYQFPDTLWFVIISGMFWRNFRTIRREIVVSHSSFSSSLPPDSKEETCPQPALALTLNFMVLAPRIFTCSGSSAVAEIVEGIWQNQEPLWLSLKGDHLSIKRYGIKCNTSCNVTSL